GSAAASPLRKRPRPVNRALAPFSLFLLAAACTQSWPDLESEKKEDTDFPDAAAHWRLMRDQDENGEIPARAWPAALEARARTVVASALAPLAGGIAPGAWVERGPSNVAGRSVSLAIDPRDPQRIFAGAVSGGLWRSTDAGASWTQIDDWW